YTFEIQQIISQLKLKFNEVSMNKEKLEALKNEEIEKLKKELQNEIKKMEEESNKSRMEFNAKIKQLNDEHEKTKKKRDLDLHDLEEQLLLKEKELQNIIKGYTKQISDLVEARDNLSADLEKKQKLITMLQSQ